MKRWCSYRCGYCGSTWTMEWRLSLPRCPNCLYSGYVVEMDKLSKIAESLRALADEMRQLARPFPTGRARDVQGSDVIRWAARLEDIASQVEREEVQR